MRRILILVCIAFILTGCSATANIEFGKNGVTEKVEIVAADNVKYSEVKNWKGFPLPLYYDTELDNPFAEKRKRESGVSYYDTTFNDELRKVISYGRFTYKDHSRSSLIRNCFKLYNITTDGSVKEFSTSDGLICSFTNFDIVVKTPYKVIDSNAHFIDEENNMYVWKINESNKNDVFLRIKIDFSKKYNQRNDIYDNGKDLKEKESNSLKIIIMIMCLSVLLTLMIVALSLYAKNRKISEM